jgi:hypothetical protein
MAHYNGQSDYYPHHDDAASYFNNEPGHYHPNQFQVPSFPLELPESPLGVDHFDNEPGHHLPNQFHVPSFPLELPESPVKVDRAHRLGFPGRANGFHGVHAPTTHPKQELRRTRGQTHGGETAEELFVRAHAAGAIRKQFESTRPKWSHPYEMEVSDEEMDPLSPVSSPKSSPWPDLANAYYTYRPAASSVFRNMQVANAGPTDRQNARAARPWNYDEIMPHTGSAGRAPR